MYYTGTKIKDKENQPQNYFKTNMANKILQTGNRHVATTGNWQHMQISHHDMHEKQLLWLVNVNYGFSPSAHPSPHVQEETTAESAKSSWVAGSRTPAFLRGCGAHHDHSDGPGQLPVPPGYSTFSWRGFSQSLSIYSLFEESSSCPKSRGELPGLGVHHFYNHLFVVTFHSSSFLSLLSCFPSLSTCKLRTARIVSGDTSTLSLHFNMFPCSEHMTAPPNTLRITLKLKQPISTSLQWSIFRSCYRAYLSLHTTRKKSKSLKKFGVGQFSKEEETGLL